MFAPFLCSVPLSVAIFFAAASPPQKRLKWKAGPNFKRSEKLLAPKKTNTKKYKLCQQKI